MRSYNLHGSFEMAPTAKRTPWSGGFVIIVTTLSSNSRSKSRSARSSSQGQRKTRALQAVRSDCLGRNRQVREQMRDIFLGKCPIMFRLYRHSVPIFNVPRLSLAHKYFANSCLPDLLVNVIATNATVSSILLHAVGAKILR